MGARIRILKKFRKPVFLKSLLKLSVSRQHLNQLELILPTVFHAVGHQLLPGGLRPAGPLLCGLLIFQRNASSVKCRSSYSAPAQSLCQSSRITKEMSETSSSQGVQQGLLLRLCLSQLLGQLVHIVLIFPLATIQHTVEPSVLISHLSQLLAHNGLLLLVDTVGCAELGQTGDFSSQCVLPYLQLLVPKRGTPHCPGLHSVHGAQGGHVRIMSLKLLNRRELS
mmetsp:Transcript_85816/g.195637  ORF Transcript_85816/g.195637 Transcript_85816/m.195637 type:complete len:224 (-) Transcript_85816:457-1128(-)